VRAVRSRWATGVDGKLPGGRDRRGRREPEAAKGNAIIRLHFLQCSLGQESQLVQDLRSQSGEP